MSVACLPPIPIFPSIIMDGTYAPTTPTAMIVFMGPTGTGKSTLINLLTKDDNIRIGHDLESQTFNITTSGYTQDDISVTLVDTPGFDDSHEGITDTDILGKIADFLQEDGGRKLNGIIYLHRISDPRMGGTAKKNLRVFREICGDKSLEHVRIVTTNWNLVDEKQGNSRQDALAKEVFEPLIEKGACLCRHDKGLKSAQSIMSQLIHKTPVTIKIQEELNEGCTLGDTSAGAMIIEEMKGLKEMHDKEVEELREEMEEALMANDEGLRLELDEERRKLEGMMARAEEDRKTLENTRKPRGTQPTMDAAQKSNSDEATTTSTTENDVHEGPQRHRGERKVLSASNAVVFGLGLMAAGPVIAAAGVGVVAATVVAGAVALCDSVGRHLGSGSSSKNLACEPMKEETSEAQTPQRLGKNDTGCARLMTPQQTSRMP